MSRGGHNKIQDEIYIKSIKSAAKMLGRSPDKEWWKKSGLTPSATSFQNRFGSWNNALAAAGVPINKIDEYTDAQILNELARVYQIIGDPFIRRRFYEYSAMRPGKLLRKWTDWLKQANIPIKRVKARKRYIKKGRVYETRWTESALKEAFERFHTEHSRYPNTNDLLTTDYLPAPSTLVYRFGSLNNFREKAGYPTREQVYGITACYGKDGHKLHSGAEQSVCNFLHNNNIDHETQVRVCPERQWTCDFVANGVYIEVDGLGERRKNIHAHNEKIRYYEDKNIPHIVIDPYTTANWENHLKTSIGLS